MDRKLLHLDFGRGKLAEVNAILNGLAGVAASDELRWAIEDLQSETDDLDTAIRQGKVNWMYRCIAEAKRIASDIKKILDRGQP
ncbi:MAG: hypothetical protein AAF743_15030 [Planctomycetota bacterium]